MILDSKIPDGPIEKKWTSFKNNAKLISPANKRKFKVIVVGTGLAGSSASATLAELGYQVETFCFHDSPRRAHSIAAQGGINAAKNYQNDGDSVWRLFYDTIKEATSAPARRMSTALPRSAGTSSTSASPRASPSPANTAANSRTAPSAAPRSPAPSTPKDRPASSSCSAPTPP
jgi:hypothetical protein